MPWVLLHHNIDRIEQPIQAPFLHKRRAQIRHDEIADEHHAEIRKIYKQPIFGFSALDRNKLDSCSADFCFRLAVDRDIGLEAPEIVRVEFTPKEARLENAGSVEHS